MRSLDQPLEPEKKVRVSKTIEVGQTLIESAKEAVEIVKTGGKRGRPAKHVDKPWEAEGISRMTWYRRQKATGK